MEDIILLGKINNLEEESQGKYTIPEDGIPESDLSEEVQEKLNSGGGGGSTLDLTKVSVFILDVLNDDITVTTGGIDRLKRRITT